jgi:amino acid transporter
VQRRLATTGRVAPRGLLRRQLGVIATAAVSVGVMAPTLAMSITATGPAGLLGRAATLAYVFAGLGVGLVAYGFVRLASVFADAGSVYAFVGQVLGPRAGFVAGWALLGTYLVFPAVSISAIAVFGRAFLHSAGIAGDAPWLPIALAGLALIWLLAAREIRTAARSLLVAEAVSIVLILALMAVIVVRLAAGDAPGDQELTADVLDLPGGTGLATIGLAATFGFLSFAGFESAGSFGEEAERPTAAIPRSMVLAIGFGTVFYVACVAVQTMGFGADAAGIKAFTGSAAPLSTLADTYVADGAGAVLSLAALVSAVGAGLGCASVCARMLFALGRDGRLPASLAHVSTATGAPTAGLAFVLGLDACGLVAFATAGTPPMRVFFYFATFGVLNLLVMYVLTNVAAIRLLARRTRPAEALLPALGIVVAGYVLYRNVWPVPEPPFDVFPYLVAAWLAVGAVWAIAARSRRLPA